MMRRDGLVNTIQSTDAVLWSDAPETYVILLASITPNKFNKRGKIMKKIYFC